ncbi:CDP-alcohol phosphatidyltransferase family protein [Thermobaculum terrenum]|nr:CDP-alcohol phosphatidyltransferase family protein [Thermobaculum terrenum]
MKHIEKYYATVPNLLALFRLLLVPILWIIALLGYSKLVALGLILAGLTDALDGQLARRLNQVTKEGARIDSLSDNLLLTSTVIWLLILKPQVFRDNTLLYILVIVVYLIVISVGWIRFRRIGNLHLYSTRAAVVIGYIFLIHTFLFPEYSKTLFYATVIAQLVASAEILAVLLTREYVDEYIGSILLWRNRSKEKLPPEK